MTARTSIKSLDELFAMMKGQDPRLPKWDALPTFGGVDVSNTIQVWSWDPTRWIVGTCADDIQIENRTDSDA